MEISDRVIYSITYQRFDKSAVWQWGLLEHVSIINRERGNGPVLGNILMLDELC